MKGVVEGISVVLVTTLVISGCTSGRLGFVQTDSCSNGYAITTQTSAKGVVLYTRPGLGVHVGKIEWEEVYPLLTDEDLTCGDFDFDGSECNPVAEGDLEAMLTDYAKNPIRINTTRAGLGLEATRSSVSGIIGAGSRNELRVDSDANFSYFYDNTGIRDKPVVCAISVQ